MRPLPFHNYGLVRKQLADIAYRSGRVHRSIRCHPEIGEDSVFGRRISRTGAAYLAVGKQLLLAWPTRERIDRR